MRLTAVGSFQRRSQQRQLWPDPEPIATPRPREIHHSGQEDGENCCRLWQGLPLQRERWLISWVALSALAKKSAFEGLTDVDQTPDEVDSMKREVGS